MNFEVPLPNLAFSNLVGRQKIVLMLVLLTLNAIAIYFRNKFQNHV